MVEGGAIDNRTLSRGDECNSRFQYNFALEKAVSQYHNVRNPRDDNSLPK